MSDEARPRQVADSCICQQVMTGAWAGRQTRPVPCPCPWHSSFPMAANCRWQPEALCPKAFSGYWNLLSHLSREEEQLPWDQQELVAIKPAPSLTGRVPWGRGCVPYCPAVLWLSSVVAWSQHILYWLHSFPLLLLIPPGITSYINIVHSDPCLRICFWGSPI